MGNLIITYKISPQNKLKVGYRVYQSGNPFTYLPKLLTAYDSPYTIQNLPDATYEVELTTYSGDCNSTPCSQSFTYVTNNVLSQIDVGINIFIAQDLLHGSNFAYYLQANVNSSQPLTFNSIFTVSIDIYNSSNNSYLSQTFDLHYPAGVTFKNLTLKTVTAFERVVNYCLVSSVTNNSNLNIQLPNCFNNF